MSLKILVFNTQRDRSRNNVPIWLSVRTPASSFINRSITFRDCTIAQTDCLNDRTRYFSQGHNISGLGSPECTICRFCQFGGLTASSFTNRSPPIRYREVPGAEGEFNPFSAAFPLALRVSVPRHYFADVTAA